MPYINKLERDWLKPLTDVIESDTIRTPGQLNYLFTLIAKSYLQGRGDNYQAMNDVIGALEGCKIEFYRRTVVDYEEKKILENGDV